MLVVMVVIFNKSSSQHNVISTVTRLQGGQSYVCESWHGQQIHFFCKVSSLALQLTQPCIL